MDKKTLEQQLNQAFNCYDIHANVTYDDESAGAVNHHWMQLRIKNVGS